MTNVLTIDDDLRMAIEWAIELAMDDQDHLLKCGNPEIDYGSEWPEVAAMKAGMFERLATVLRQMGDDGLADSCVSLATQFKETIDAE